MTRSCLSLGLLGGAVILLLVLASTASFVIFAGILLATAISGAGGWIAERAGIDRRGFLALLAPSLRRRGEEVMARAAAVLRRWFGAQLLSMAVVGVLTALGLWAVGVPLALLLGLIAGLLAFVPNIGPIIAAIPALLLASTVGGTTVLLTVDVLVAVQGLESYLITRKIQQETVALPPAVLIAAQLTLGLIFGLSGLLFAGPLTAVGMTLVNELYRRDFLEREGPAPTSRAGARGVD